MLSTLQDVIKQLSPGEAVEHVVSQYALTYGLQRACRKGGTQDDFRIPLQGPDYFGIGLSAQTLLPRAWLQSLRSIARSAGVLRPAHVKTVLEPVSITLEAD
jgi:hypothetical protein